MADFYSDFHGSFGLTAEQYFYKQVFDAFKANTENQTLPFFNKDLDKIPRELSTGKIINNENSIALEQIASKNGYSSNLWIYGDELNKLQKEVGNLYYKKGTQPALCLTKYFGATHLNEQDLNIAEGGSKKREQYLYNLDCLDEKSRQKVLKYYELANEADRKYTESNFKAFRANCNNVKESPEAKMKMKTARERSLAASQQGGMNLSMITQCHYLHNLSNAVGKPNDIHFGLQNPAAQRQCYETCRQFSQKVENDGMKPQVAGKMLCTALNSGTEFQRISVAKGYNLENAKKIEELKVAEANRNKPYRRSGGVSY
ncbi:MAG: hypothetical protein IJ207_08780 [Treponema sp.]|uniref:hypothetical protein n=1 Tax=Treponema sp. TaxID=166 RepID=UPI0025F466F5|nr:hypothetical protein [Treponema sp.]MBQ9282276.1 hypothetical protein [Treponema sp.]